MVGNPITCIKFHAFSNLLILNIFKQNRPVDSQTKNQGLKNCDWLRSTDEIVKIDCGTSHVAILYKNGTVYTYGDNLKYQLGHLRSDYAEEVFSDGQFFVDIACSSTANFALDKRGKVYMFGVLECQLKRESEYKMSMIDVT